MPQMPMPMEDEEYSISIEEGDIEVEVSLPASKLKELTSSSSLSKPEAALAEALRVLRSSLK